MGGLKNSIKIGLLVSIIDIFGLGFFIWNQCILLDKYASFENRNICRLLLTRSGEISMLNFRIFNFSEVVSLKRISRRFQKGTF